MPGILPMKMIRVGQTTQSRIAQACDRCRSKKIRCDGIRPCCSQCAGVGFECKTSDKLSRRAFPRGYTESLEDRVRGLEAEVRELKGLLDEKDEKIDMLSRIHNFSPQSRKSSLSPTSVLQLKSEAEPSQDDLILVEIPAPVQSSTSSAGTSTTAALVEAFEEKVQKSGQSCPPISSSILLKAVHHAAKASAAMTAGKVSPAPPRLLSDQYINLYFQEWQPMLPILHRPTFLRIYEQYLIDPESHSWQTNRHGAAQLFLIFEIAAHSQSSKARPSTTAYELQWRKALSSISSVPSLATLQCHVLAQVVYLLKADYPHLLRHRAYAVSMIHQMSLHQGYKCHPLPIFEAETRKRVLWCQYVLDKFASATTGTPQMLRDTDITTELPTDVDDENINAQGISPVLPGELTKMSSALALFRVSKILGKTLEHLYPAKGSYRLSITKLHSLSDELDQWQEEVPDHLRLRFCNDKPATNLISCRSPLLSLAYFYVRSLIHRPLLCYGSGSAASAATIVIAAAAKHELQILDLLDERSMNYTFPLSKQDVLMNAGISILWQSMDLEEDSKLLKDNQKSLGIQLTKLIKENALSGAEFHKIATSFLTIQVAKVPAPTHIDIDSPAARVLSTMPAPNAKQPKSTRKQLQAIASRLSSFNGKSKHEEGSRRNTFSQPGLSQSLSPCPRNHSTVSLSSTRSAPPMSLPTPPANLPALNRALDNNNASAINLDYFPFSEECYMGLYNPSTSMLPAKKSPYAADAQSNWEQIMTNMDANTPDMFSTVSPDALNTSTSVSAPTCDWAKDIWQMSILDMAPKNNVPQSLLSFSDESLTSTEELVFSAPTSHKGSLSTTDGVVMSPDSNHMDEPFKGIAIPVDDDFDFHEIHG